MGIRRREVASATVIAAAAATLVAAVTAYGISVLTVGKMAPKGTPVPVLGHVYYLTMGTASGLPGSTDAWLTLAALAMLTPAAFSV